jgi:hypothetical protein
MSILIYFDITNKNHENTKYFYCKKFIKYSILKIRYKIYYKISFVANKKIFTGK